MVFAYPFLRAKIVAQSKTARGNGHAKVYFLADGWFGNSSKSSSTKYRKVLWHCMFVAPAVCERQCIGFALAGGEYGEWSFHTQVDRRGHGTIATLQDMWKEQGFRGLYQGLPAELVRSLMFQAILMATKEKIEGANRRWLMRR
jgi:hypothetical protein